MEFFGIQYFCALLYKNYFNYKGKRIAEQEV